MSDDCKEVVKIIRGSKKRFTVNLRKDDDPLDLTTNNEITVILPGESAAQTLTKTGAEVTILSASLGKIQVDVPAAKSDLLAIGEEQTIEIQVQEIALGDPEIFQILESLSVVDSIS